MTQKSLRKFSRTSCPIFLFHYLKKMSEFELRIKTNCLGKAMKQMLIFFLFLCLTHFSIVLFRSILLVFSFLSRPFLSCLFPDTSSHLLNSKNHLVILWTLDTQMLSFYFKAPPKLYSGFKIPPGHFLVSKYPQVIPWVLDISSIQHTSWSPPKSWTPHSHLLNSKHPFGVPWILEQS